MTGWRTAARGDLDSVLSFLLRDESLCVPFTARLRSGGRGQTVFVASDERGSVTGTLLLTTTGLLLPLLEDGAPAGPDLARMLRTVHPPVQSIMGTGRSTGFVEAVMPTVPTARIEYFLMSVTRPAARPALPPLDRRVSVRLATEADADLLFPLQRAYELEEVVVDPRHFSDAQCLKLLRKTLKEELVFVALKDGVPLAKAATNARGFAVDQIGGVFTVPEARGMGLGKMVVSALLKRVLREKEAACLFVKKRNRPAIALYERLGFAPVTDYVISYYGL
ncbi:MAG TPA: GNAT family N-acetyltransferase [Spirochaetia bacterium]|nr:GNAT family N-acetyltransferase [Spirochaetia bacterium]